MAAVSMYPSAFSSPQPQSSSPSSPSPPFTAYQQPPQLAYGWWVDILPPRGPYLWPCNPSSYKITEPISIQHEASGGAQQTAAAKAGESPSFLTQPPQMCFGWYVSSPPLQPPYFWSCLPPGYTIVPLDQLGKLQGQRSNMPLTTTTRQGNVTLTLPTPGGQDPLHPPASSQSIGAFYPQSKTQSLIHPPSQSESLGFLNLSQADEGLGAMQAPLPVRSPALEGLANVAVPGAGGDFVLDQETSQPGAEAEEEEGRRGKRKRTGKVR